jgi:hypothetical protein
LFLKADVCKESAGQGVLSLIVEEVVLESSYCEIFVKELKDRYLKQEDRCPCSVSNYRIGILIHSILIHRNAVRRQVCWYGVDVLNRYLFVQCKKARSTSSQQTSVPDEHCNKPDTNDSVVDVETL